MRRPEIIGATLLVALCLGGGGARAESVKIATWNLNWFTIHLPPGPQFPADAPHREPADIAALRQYADRLKADVIGFQEVDGADSAAALFPPARYQLATIREAVPQQVGLAVRRPITLRQNDDVRALDVEAAEAPFRLRYGLDAWLTFPGGATLRLLVVHLKTGCHTDTLETSRRPQCALLAAQIPALSAWVTARAAEHVAFALLGDLNRDLDVPEELSAALAVAAPLVRITQGASDPCWGGGAFIDHILLGGAARTWLVPGSLRVMTYRSQNERDKDRLSDHCPVSAWLDLP